MYYPFLFVAGFGMLLFCLGFLHRYWRLRLASFFILSLLGFVIKIYKVNWEVYFLFSVLCMSLYNWNYSVHTWQNLSVNPSLILSQVHQFLFLTKWLFLFINLKILFSCLYFSFGFVSYLPFVFSNLQTHGKFAVPSLFESKEYFIFLRLFQNASFFLLHQVSSAKVSHFCLPHVPYWVSH